MKQLNLYYLGGGGGGGTVPNGATVTPTDDIQIWLHCADIWDKSYTTLAEVLADADTLSALISSNNAVDYMVRSTTWAVSQALVPTMTSNTTPSGECFGSTPIRSDYSWWKAFDGDDNSPASMTTSATTASVGYHFTSAVGITAFDFLLKSGSALTISPIKISYSDDGVTYTDIEETFSTVNSVVCHGSFKSYGSHPYWKLTRTTNTAKEDIAHAVQFHSASIPTSNIAMLLIGANNYAANTLLGDSTWLTAICDSDYYSNVLNVSVPDMTSNTTPSGVASSSSVYGTGYEAFRAFDNNLGSIWASIDSDKRGWIQYMFPKAVHIYMVYNRISTTPLSRQFKVFDLTASNDGNTWENLGRYDNGGVTGASIKAAITNNGVYKYYRCTGVQNVDSLDLCGCCELNFYGREDV